VAVDRMSHHGATAGQRRSISGLLAPAGDAVDYRLPAEKNHSRGARRGGIANGQLCRYFSRRCGARSSGTRPMPKEIRLNAFDMNCVGHIQHGMWTHPHDRSASSRRELVLHVHRELLDLGVQVVNRTKSSTVLQAIM
jgi:hypothetical protein